MKHTTLDAHPDSVVVATLLPARLPSAAAARYLGVSAQTLSNWRYEGRGPTYRRDGRPHSRVYYRVADLDAWLQQGDAAATD